jgi:flagellar protein FlgJ
LPATLLAPGAATSKASHGAEAAAESATATGDTAKSFVARFAADAAAAAERLGVEPKLLLAQAALETGWGEAAPQHPDGRPTHNMFGIKAGGSWSGERAAHWTLENSGGVAERKRAMFRAYPSSTASFADYVSLIAGSQRYAAALEKAADPAAYVHAITQAGYATDPQYADKWLSIYRGDRLDGALRDLKPGAFGSTQ